MSLVPTDRATSPFLPPFLALRPVLEVRYIRKLSTVLMMKALENNEFADVIMEVIEREMYPTR